MTGIWLISYIALWILVVILAVIVLLTLRSLSVVVETVKQFHHSEDDTPAALVVGEPVPDVELLTRDGAAASLHSLGGMDTAVVVISAGCGPCRDVLAEVGDPASISDPLNLQVARTMLIGVGEVHALEHELTEAQIPPTLPVFFDDGQRVVASWGIRGTPTILIVDAHWQFVRASTGFLPRTRRNGVRSA